MDYNVYLGPWKGGTPHIISDYYANYTEKLIFQNA